MAENGEKTMVPADGEEPVDTAEKLLQLIADKERLAKFRYIHCRHHFKYVLDVLTKPGRFYTAKCRVR